jgi:thiosulfate reductase cytochrome b subunit
MKKVYIYDTFNRIWHWAQAALIIFLMITGFEIHGTYTFFGYETAVQWHNIAAISFIALIVLAIFWHFTSGTWRQYIPTTQNIIAHVRYYTLDIFQNKPHPVNRSVLSKLNPLQKLVYLGFKIMIIPVMVTTGLMYMYYRYPMNGKVQSLDLTTLEPIAVLHTLGAFLLVQFLIAHLYLITTGHTISSNLTAMITGYEELESDDENKETNLDVEISHEKQ